MRHASKTVAPRDYNTGMNNSAEGVARAFVRAINRQDLEGLAALMAPEHRFVDSLGAVVEGREAVLAAWAGYFRMVPDYSIAVEETLCDGAIVVMLGVAQGTYALAGELKVENRWETPAAFRAFVEDGLVAEWRVYADNEPIRQKMRKP
ncbi:MAG: nuclear transport factor 2 family protein [Terracidiphilus sp.]|jgi:ketosteroid isomerase-like protein